MVRIRSNRRPRSPSGSKYGGSQLSDSVQLAFVAFVATFGATSLDPASLPGSTFCDGIGWIA